MRLIILDIPKPVNDDVPVKINDTPRIFIDFAYSLFVTLLTIVIGGVITVFSTIVVLEAIHTKNLIIDLFVVSITITAGAITAIAIRRALLKTKSIETLSRVNR